MRNFSLKSMIAMLAFGLHAMAAAATTSADIQKAVSSLAAYEDGKETTGLRMIDAMLRSEPSGSPALRELEQRLADLIAGPATHEAKTEACKFLCVIGGEASQAPLVSLLKDEKVAEIAVLALTHYPASADKALREALPGARGRGAVAIAGLLGERRDRDAVAPLSAFAAGGDAQAIDAAAMALGNIGTPDAAAALEKLRAAKPVRLSALMGSLRCAYRLAEDGKNAEADALCEKLLEPAYPLHVRRGAFLKRCELAPANQAALILALLKSGPADIKSAAIARVAAITDRTEADKVLAAMPTLNPNEQALLISALGRMTAAWVRPAVLAAASSQDTGIRLAALAALARVGDDSCVPTIVAAVKKTGDDREKAIGLAALRDVPGDAAGAAILSAAQAAEGAHKADLISVLADRGVAAAVPLMQAASDAPEAVVRRAALRGFAFLSGADTLPSLIQMFLARVGDPSAADFERAIVILSDKVDPPAARADLLIKEWEARPDPAIRGALARVLGAVATDAALEKLQKAMDETQPQVRDAAIRALIAWPDNRALPAIEGIARNSQDDRYRILAIRGISTMERKDLGRFVKLLGELLSKSPSVPVAKESLAALAQIAHPFAIKTAATKLSDAALQNDAVVAIITAGERTKPENLAAAKGPIEAALNVADAGLKPRLQGLLDKIR